ncbi:S8 family serine peptidase [Hufsiella ginkgonis]|uniref:S8 family serine peptidase n=1 Tax=Hufsiella ginkgonis TaxID=2695274 RepID=A0A7K1XUE4_9SPHI|nr:S8 family serine peptidase [Hufsiella ginkgonis]MXV14602.1 S8 family serine peptidase [Hufsiella ginkgonis]
MKKLLLLFLTLLSGGVFAQDAATQKKSGYKFTLPAGVTTRDYRPGILIVKFKPVTTSGAKVQNTPATPQIRLTGAQVVSVTRKFPAETVSGGAATISKAAADNGLDRIYEVKFTGGKIEDLVNELLLDPRIEYAEPDYVYHVNYDPSDPRFATNQAYLTVVKAPEAWNLIRSSSNIVIGIVDSGSDLTHQDLAANIYTNTADPVNGVDDDRDGYIDNFKGWDLVGNSGSNIREDNDPAVKSDSTSHGVHVSGIAGAVTDNGIGVASISFNPKLLIVKCGADNNGSSIYRGYDGIKYAADHGAKIINCSWGGPGGGSYGLDIINYALAKDCLIIAAAGNDNTTTPDYPSAYPGVFAVANTTNTDVKSGSSNYGPHVALSAPGTSIFNTYYNSTYTSLTGTSMSSPMVAAAAALLKSYVPSLTMQQVGERLRATADNIDAKNPNYAGMLGKGRLNVYRALTESPPSIRYQKITLADKSNGNIPAGDTVTLYFNLKNFLSPVTNLQVKLSSANSNVTVTGADQTVASLVTDGTANNVGPFKVYIKPTTPDNSTVIFKLQYTANGGAYTESETFTTTVNLDYLNIQVNKVWTTMTSNGRVGYSRPSATNGQGFIYNNQNLLYEASLMIGTSANKLSDNARISTNTFNDHFVKRVRATKSATTTAAFEGASEFDDSGNPSPLNIYVKHRQVAYAAVPDDKYTIVEYEIFNTTTADMSGVYAGLLTDFDIDGGSTDVTKYDANTRLAYVFKKTGSFPYAGIKLLNAAPTPLYYPMTYMLSGDPLADDNFSAAEKFTTLSSGIKASGLGESSNGYDVQFVSGYGPLKIPAKGSVKIAFAFMAGDNLADIQASAAAAQAKYISISPEEPPIANTLVLSQNFPNPVTEKTTVEFSIPEGGQVSVALYDLVGRKVKTYLNEFLAAGVHTLNISSFDLQNGIYMYKIKYRGEEKALKMMVAK